MASELPYTVQILPGKRTVKFDTPAAQPILQDHYLSSEEDLSSSEQDSVASMPTEAPASRSHSQRSAGSLSAAEIDEQVARTITFIAPGKARLIDVNAPDPIYEAHPAVRTTEPTRSIEPYMRLRIREGRELDRMARGRNWAARAFSKEDPYCARKPLLSPLNTFGSRPAAEGGDATRRKQAPIPLLCHHSDSTALAGCGPSKLAIAHSTLRGVANTLISARRKTGFSEPSCLAHA